MNGNERESKLLKHSICVHPRSFAAPQFGLILERVE